MGFSPERSEGRLKVLAVAAQRPDLWKGRLAQASSSNSPNVTSPETAFLGADHPRAVVTGHP